MLYAPEIVKLMRDLEGQHPERIVEVGDIVEVTQRRYPKGTRSRFRYAMVTMARRGMVERVGKGLYRIR